MHHLTARNRDFNFGQWLMLCFALASMWSMVCFADTLSLPVLRVPETRLTGPDVKPAVYGMMFKPRASQPAPAVVILHGRSGIFPDYRLLAQRLADQGYVALVLDYYAESGGVPPRDEPRRKEMWPGFERTVQQSIHYLGQRADVDANRIGLLGLSQGAMLAISTAGITPEVKVVVTYYPRTPWSFDEIVEHLPPLLILHGEVDPWHKAAAAQLMHDTLAQHGKSVAIKIYPATSHGFNMLSRFYRPEAAVDAERRALAFLAEHLRPEPGAGASSLEGFAATVTHFYTIDLPSQLSVPGGSVEGLFDLPVFARERYAYTNEYNKTSGYEERRKKLIKFYAQLLKRGVHRQPIYKIEAIKRTDATHGVVTYTAITNQIHTTTQTNRLTMQPGISHWEKIGAQWRLISDKVGSPYRTAARVTP